MTTKLIRQGGYKAETRHFYVAQICIEVWASWQLDIRSWVIPLETSRGQSVWEKLNLIWFVKTVTTKTSIKLFFWLNPAVTEVLNTIVNVSAELIGRSAPSRSAGLNGGLSNLRAHANLSELWSNTVAQSSKPINPCCRCAVGSWDLRAQCVKWGLCLFMCDRVSHLLLPFNRIRRRTSRWLLVWPTPPPGGANSRSPKTYGRSKAWRLKYNLELCTANHMGSLGNNTPWCWEEGSEGRMLIR